MRGQVRLSVSPVLAAEADLALASLCLARLEAVVPSSPGPGLGEVLARATERDRGELQHGACLSCHVSRCHVSHVRPAAADCPELITGIDWAGLGWATHRNRLARNIYLGLNKNIWLNLSTVDNIKNQNIEITAHSDVENCPQDSNLMKSRHVNLSSMRVLSGCCPAACCRRNNCTNVAM